MLLATSQICIYLTFVSISNILPTNATTKAYGDKGKQTEGFEQGVKCTALATH